MALSIRGSGWAKIAMGTALRSGQMVPGTRECGKIIKRMATGASIMLTGTHMRETG